MSTAVSAPPRDLIGSGEAAERLGVDPRTFVRWCQAGRLESYSIAGRWKVSASWLDRWIVDQRYTPPLPPPPAPIPGQTVLPI